MLKNEKRNCTSSKKSQLSHVSQKASDIDI